MTFSEEDKHVIKFFRQNKHYEANRFLKEFPHKSWSRSELNKIIRKIDRTGTSKRLPGSVRPRTAQTADKIEEAETLFLSRKICRKHTVLEDKLLGKLVHVYLNVPLIL